MNRKLILGAVAGVAAIGLAVGGTTYAAYSDFGNVNSNSVAAGILKLQLSGDNGSAIQSVNWGSLAPGQDGVRRAIFVASSAGDSVPTANLSLTIQNLKDHENGCDTLSEYLAEHPAAHLTGTEHPSTLNCGNTGANNNAGELSHALDMRINSFPADDAATCAGALDGSHPWGWGLPAGGKSDVLGNAAGNLDTANASGTPVQLNTSPIAAGHGICVVLGSWFGDSGSSNAATNALDNAAQGDSLSFDMRLDLVQTP
jgi:predicted ribosomally synthesized peptide with SipW-like signal peptide